LQMPQEINGNASTKYGDYYWVETTIGKRIIFFGGVWNDAATDGLSSFNLYISSSDFKPNVGSRLLKTAL
ncbi:MAG: hypothetical protein RSE48_01165, partial [Bacilli bacterium]